MRSTTAFRFLASLLLALGIGGGMVLGGAYLLPDALAHVGLDIRELSRCLAVQARGPEVNRRLDEAIRDMAESRQAREAVAAAVARGTMTEADGLMAFLDQAERDAALRRRLAITWPDASLTERVRRHFRFCLDDAREEAGTPAGRSAL